MTDAALKHFRKIDKVLFALAKSVGTCSLEPKKNIDPYLALSKSIIYQQLSTKAAATIYSRVRALTPDPGFPNPESIIKLPIASLRGAGLSGAKSSYIKDLAAHALAGTLPKPRAVRRMSDAELIDALTKVKGIGAWSVEMYLMFTLCRPDVLPIGDLGVRKGFAKVYGHAELPTPQELYSFGERWRPFRSTASWYMWRALEHEAQIG